MKPRRFAFTLLELLVSISIIALLVALVMPALSKSRDTARNMVCKSNLHQQGVAVQSYAHDNRGVLPHDAGLYKINTNGTVVETSP